MVTTVAAIGSSLSGYDTGDDQSASDIPHATTRQERQHKHPVLNPRPADRRQGDPRRRRPDGFRPLPVDRPALRPRGRPGTRGRYPAADTVAAALRVDA